MEPRVPGKSGRMLRRRWGVGKNPSAETAHDVAGAHDATADDAGVEAAQPHPCALLAVDEGHGIRTEPLQELPAARVRLGRDLQDDVVADPDAATGGEVVVGEVEV